MNWGRWGSDEFDPDKIKSIKSSEGAVGQDTQPIDLFARADNMSLEHLMGEGATAYVEEFHLEATDGEYIITAEDDTVIIEYVEAHK